MLGTRTIATLATVAAILAAPGGCTKKAPTAQACNPIAIAATPIPAHLVAFTAPVPTEILYVNACAVDITGGKFDLVHLPIRIEYDVVTSEPVENNPQLGVGFLRMNNMHVQATTTYTHPITYPIDLPFTLTVTIFYTGKNRNDVGKVVECWTETGRNTIHYEHSAVERATITRNNYNITSGTGAAQVTCVFTS